MPQIIQHPTLGPIEFPDSMSDTDIVSAIKKLETPKPATDSAQIPTYAQKFAAANALPNNPIAGMGSPIPGVPLTPANVARLGVAADWMGDKAKAIANFVKNNPGVAADVALKGGGQAIGQRLGGPAGGFMGGFTGDALAQARQAAFGNRQSFDTGEALANAVGGVVPVKSMAAATPAEMGITALKFAGANTAATTAQTLVDQKRLPTASEVSQSVAAGAAVPLIGKVVDTGAGTAAGLMKQSQAATRDETFQMAMQRGFKLDPALSDPNLGNKAVQKMAGTSALQNTLKDHNNQVATQLAKGAIGVDPNTALSDMVFADRSLQMRAPYRALAGVSTGAAQAVKDWEENSSGARAAWRAFQNTGDTTKRDAALKFESLAENAQQEMARQARASGNPGMIADIAQAKKDLAQLHVVESATNPATGAVDPKVIGAIRDAKRGYLTGDLDVIGRLALAMPQVVGEPVARTSGSLPAAVAHAMGRMAVNAAGVPAIMRAAATSGPYQKFLTMPSYATQRPDFTAQFAQLAGQDAVRPNPQASQ